MKLPLVTPAIALAALASCTSDYYPLVQSPDGSHWWYDLTCSTKGDCMDEARAACNSDYQIKDSNAAKTFGMAASKRFGDVTVTSSQAHTDLEILVECKSDVRPPGTNRTVSRICKTDPLARTSMQQGIVCPPSTAPVP